MIVLLRREWPLRSSGADPLVCSQPPGRHLAPVRKGRRGRRPRTGGSAPPAFLSVFFSSSVARCGTCLLLTAFLAYAQDTRKVSEPKIPSSCTVLLANLTAQNSTLAEADENKADTTRIQEAMDHCPPGQAVELKANDDRNAFLTGPLQLRRGVTLLVNRGAILFGSRNPRDYDLEPGLCGTITERGHGCKAILNGDHVADAAVMGEGIIDGRGGAKIMGQNITWWDLAEKARKGGIQNNPRIMILSHCDNFTLYWIQLKDSPNFHVSYGSGNGFTAWGVIVNAPKNARNTDAIDPWQFHQRYHHALFHPHR